MNVSEPQRGPDSASRPRSRLRLVGVLVLLAGLGGAGLTYWLETRSPDVMDDVSMLRFNQAERQQTGRLYGKMGLMIDDWMDDLKQPGTQAALIAGTAILIAGGCFYFAPRPDDGDETR